MCRKLGLFFYLVFTLNILTAQVFKLDALLDSAKLYRIKTLDAKHSFAQRSSHNAVFSAFLQKIIQTKGANSIQGIDSTLKIAYLVSEDQKLELFTWEIPNDKNGFNYFAYANYHTKSGNKITEFLGDSGTELTDKIIYKKLSPFEWYGGIYYHLTEVTHKKKKYYVVACVNKANPLMSKKVLDVLSFSEKGECTLGKSVFYNGKRNQFRLVFLYSPQAYFSIQYSADNKAFTFDHLSPSNPNLVGRYEFYVPDLSFDSYKYEKGRWIFLSDVDFRGEYNKPYNPKNKPAEKEIYKTK